MACSPCDALEQSIDIEDGSSTSGSATSEDTSTIGWKNWMNLIAYAINTGVTYTSLTGIFGATNTELSDKYQTLVTPAGWAFSIWGPIFIWEGVFVVAQFLPRFRKSQPVVQISPWWWALCVFQTTWTIVFAQDQITLALLLMLSILVSLSGIARSTDGQQMSVAEYFLLRAPFSLQLGWIIVASVLNASVQADAAKASQETLLALSVMSSAGLLAIVAIFTFGVKSPDPIVGLVAAWALAAISSELSDPVKLNDPARFNPSEWDALTVGGLQKAAIGLSALSAVMAVVAAASRIHASCRTGSEAAGKE